MAGWMILLHAHDYIWLDRRILLIHRLAACDLIHRTMIRLS